MLLVEHAGCCVKTTLPIMLLVEHAGCCMKTTLPIMLLVEQAGCCVKTTLPIKLLVELKQLAGGVGGQKAVVDIQCSLKGQQSGVMLGHRM